MKYILFILLSFVFLNLKAQLPTGVPTQKINGWAEANYYVPDSGVVISKRDTSWRPRFVGTSVTWQHAGVDTVQWFWTGAKWARGTTQGALTWQQTLANGSVLNRNNLVASDGFDFDWHNTDEFGIFKQHMGSSDALFYLTHKVSDGALDSTVFRFSYEDGEVLMGSYASDNSHSISFANGQEASFEYTNGTTQSNKISAFNNTNTIFAGGSIFSTTINQTKDSIIIRGDSSTSRGVHLRMKLLGLPQSTSSTDSQMVKTATGLLAYRASTGGGTVTSVGLTMPTAFTVTSTTTNPITTSGTYNVTANGTSAQYIKGNGVLGTTDTSMIPSFFTKVRSLFSGTSPITYSSTTGAIGINIADVSGTLGAATFDGSYFTTNGSGLISLKIPGSGAASCSPCKVTFNAVGQATTVASNSVNNGLSLRSDSVQLGQTIGAGGSPATLTHSTEIPLGAYDLRFLNIGTNNANAFALYAASNKNDSSGYISFRASDGTEYSRINVDGNFNTFFGLNSGLSAVTGGAGSVANTFYGAGNNGAAITLAKDNVGVGVDVLQRMTTGRDNIGIGSHVMQQCTTCSANTSIGYTTMASATTATFNIAIGGDHILQAALQSNQTGSNNIAIGYGALGEAGHVTNNQADRIAIGFKAFGANLVGFKTIGIGDSIAMRGASVGVYNVLLGGNMFSQDNNARVVGDSNVIIGSGVGVTSEVDMGSNNIILGNSTQWGTSFSNSMLLGFGLTNNISNIVRLGRADQNVIVGVTANQADNGYKHQVYGSGFFRDSLKIGNMPTGSGTDSILVSRNGVVYKILQSGGITTLNTLTAATQTFATGTSGSDFNISSSTSTHTFNIPSASTSNRGLVTISSQTFGGNKTFNDGIIVTSSANTPRISVTGNFSTASEPGIAGVELGMGNFTYTDNGASRTVSQGQNISLIGQPTITSGNAITYSGDASTVRFVGAPVAAGSMTISHPWNIFANNNNYISGIAFGLNEQNTSASLGDAAFNVFAGTTATYTLPALSTWPGKIYYIKNAGSGNLTVSRAGSDNLYTTTSVTTITVAAGASVVILAGSAFWYVM